MRSMAAFVVVGIVLAGAAFTRWYFLLGIGGAFVAAALVALTVFCWSVCFFNFRKKAMLDACVAGVSSVGISLFVGTLIVSPTTIDPHFEEGFASFANQRAWKAEINAVLSSDSAFQELRMSTRVTGELKQRRVWLQLSGAIPTHADFARLYRRLSTECDHGSPSEIYWDLKIEKTKDRLQGSGDELSPTKHD